ncbi:MAG: hypothetical protein JWM11_1122 [Planctomycetaceae bacterium]|nr:hypothetical protein [Planctomycetaceae bacterium]
MRIHLYAVLGIGSLILSGCSQGQSSQDLIEDLSSTNQDDRIKAVRLLQQHKGDATQVVPALIKSLKDQQSDIRWSAAIGLGYYGAEAKSAVHALEAAQHDTDGRVREAASVALSRIVRSK